MQPASTGGRLSEGAEKSSTGHSIQTSLFGSAIVWWAFVIATWMCGRRYNNNKLTKKIKKQDGTGSNVGHFPQKRQVFVIKET